MDQENIKVGVGVMIFKDGKILMGKRKGSHGEGEYSFPGGHLEYMEYFEEAAIRETKEETGMSVKNIKFQLVSNIKRYNPKHYVHIGVTADWQDGEPQVFEPNKCDGWDWYYIDNLPSPIFYPAEIMIDSYKTGKNYFIEE